MKSQPKFMSVSYRPVTYQKLNTHIAKETSFDKLNSLDFDKQAIFLHAQNISFSEDKLFQKAYSFNG